MESCLYEGRVRHRRLTPVEHDFEFPLFMLYLDLDELPDVFRGRWLWSAERPALARFRRADHLGDPAVPLSDAVRALVAERTGLRPRGPIRLLTQLCYAGFVFNPVSFYYCFAEGGRTLEAVVAEVHNTPWGERHCYVLRPGSPGQRGWLRCRAEKSFHVSPFMEMDVSHHFAFREPGPRLSARIENVGHGGQRPFDAVLSLTRREIGGRSLARVLVRYPLMTGQVLAGIYWHAFRLWWKGADVHAHPASLASLESPS